MRKHDGRDTSNNATPALLSVGLESWPLMLCPNQPR